MTCNKTLKKQQQQNQPKVITYSICKDFDLQGNKKPYLYYFYKTKSGALEFEET